MIYQNVNFLFANKNFQNDIQNSLIIHVIEKKYMFNQCLYMW